MPDLFPNTHPAQASIPALPQMDGLSHDTWTVALAMALLWSLRSQTEIINLLRALGLRRSDGRDFVGDDVKAAQRELQSHQGLVQEAYRPGFQRLQNDLRAPLYRHLLDSMRGDALRQALFKLEGYDPARARIYWPVGGFAPSVGILRVMLFSGMPREEFDAVLRMAGTQHDSRHLLLEAALLGFDPDTFRRIHPEMQGDLLFEALTLLSDFWISGLVPAREYAIRLLDSQPEALTPHSRVALADQLLQQGDWPRFERALEGRSGGAVDALRAARLALEGRFDEALPQFEAAIKRAKAETGARKQFFPDSLSWYYPLCLLARPTQANLETARKFCVAESGRREPDAQSPWGRWVHAIAVRSGQVELNHWGFAVSHNIKHLQLDWDLLWHVLLAAWLGPEALRLDKKELAGLDNLAGKLSEYLAAQGMTALQGQVDAARAVLGDRDPPDDFFVAGRRERWREVLAALRGFTDGQASLEKPDAQATSRFIWTLSLGRNGQLQDIKPLEQKRGARGWGKAKPTSLARLVGNADLPPHDAKAARCLRSLPYSREQHLDRVAAINALLGHPHVALAEAPETFLELVAGSPELEVIRTDQGFRLRVSPAPHPEREEEYYFTAESRKEAEALRYVSVLRDGPQRLRLVQLNEAQRRTAQLLGKDFELPEAARDDLSLTLQGLARQFQVLGDNEAASREEAPETRLRAELSPSGEGLTLRLVAAPLGPQGPRFTPGQGRERILAALGAETVGTRRDLAAEGRHLDAVLDALPFLVEAGNEEDAEWLLADPEQALTAVENLPHLPALAAVDWPKGKPVKVIQVNARNMAIKIQSDRDWFHLDGQATLDDGLVLGFTALLEAAQGRSRYIQMGDGVYAALTRSLKEQLAELASVAEPTGKGGKGGQGGSKLPHLAAGWLADTLDGLEVDSDADFRAAVERLQTAQQSQPALPGTLQAELRPYQEDGYVWAMRLAQSGFGGCLADDMGLGKTLQALAVLLARAPDGAALVVAPTSVCGNWLAEIQRFAPSLNAHIYAEAERAELLAGAGPLDVVIVSYTLLQQAGDDFAARPWHTLVADEAQAVKNAAAKRSRALFKLDAGFRLALSGTPVENRLGELWSIMRFANPGLLGTEGRFNERFAAPIERSRDREAQHRLRRLIAPFILRRTKAQVLRELPERTEQILHIVPGPAEAAHYEALRRQAVAQVENSLESANAGVARFNILAQLTRLRRAACDPRLASVEPPIIGAKVQAFAELAVELAANGHKALVFSQFVDFLHLLRDALDAAGLAYQYLDGATPAAERTRRVAAFQAGEGELFLISLKAGGFGLNLTAADYVIITDPWWNPAAEDQAMGRAHRMGQLRPVTVYRLVLKGSIEERILDLHDDKRALAEGVLSGEESAALPTTEDLLALMRGIEPRGRSCLPPCQPAAP